MTSRRLKTATEQTGWKKMWKHSKEVNQNKTQKEKKNTKIKWTKHPWTVRDKFQLPNRCHWNFWRRDGGKIFKEIMVSKFLNYNKTINTKIQEAEKKKKKPKTHHYQTT